MFWLIAIMDDESEPCVTHRAEVTTWVFRKTKSLIIAFVAAIEAEKEKNKFLNGIENFDPTKLKHTETCEKNPLPTKDVIEQEKSA